ncbi:hypothetical protein ACGF13_18295 [Kitasatospora sp. NPDC048286]|uniref:hypothetical protein n=1 Tax=Kitasatospora sp. NPDC048286 TaxID=3364047 RepID=UPI003713CE73
MAEHVRHLDGGARGEPTRRDDREAVGEGRTAQHRRAVERQRHGGAGSERRQRPGKDAAETPGEVGG